MRLFPLFPIFLGVALAAEPRVWTDVQGRKIEASLVKSADGSVLLKLKDGRELPYPLDKLSEADREYVKSHPPKAEGGDETEDADISKKLNFDEPWPERIKFGEDPAIKTVEEDPTEKRFIYESANYRYVCDVRLAQSVVKGFAVMFEATHLFCRSLPLSINGGVKIEGKHLILLFEQFDDYVRAGGPPSSAGVFISGRGIVMVPLSSLGVKPVGSGYMLDREKSNSTLPHELTHQLTPECYFEKGAMGWFSEGIAEYVASTPYRSGGFAVHNNQREIVEYVTGYGTKDRGGRALGKEIRLPPLKEFMLQSYASFTGNPQVNYGCGLLITYYFLHMDGAGDGKRIKSYLKALHEGKDAEKSLELLLDGRTFPQLEEELAKSWSRRGVDFTFSKS